ncbi:MAG: Dabb family protein, partial [Clostridia bacterium]|nr:Dabb family protein [Clostridia bacterium]
MIKHIVLFKFEDPAVNIPVVRESLYALVPKIPEIVHMQIGADFLHSGRSYDMALLVDFKSREDLEI